MTTTPSLRERLRTLDAAEDFFELFAVSYDPAVLRVTRLHVLQRLGARLVKEALDDADDATLEEAYRRALTAAYRAVVEGGADARPAFAVFERARRQEQARFVALDQLELVR